jgi:hypothetical protein
MKSWTDKLHAGRPHQVKAAPIDIAGMKRGQIMLVPSPQIVDAFIRAIPHGQGMDVPMLRRRLARKYKAEVTCPITMGFQLRIVAEAMLEVHANGVPLKNLTPVWRVLDESVPVLGRLGAGKTVILAQRRAEKL